MTTALGSARSGLENTLTVLKMKMFSALSPSLSGSLAIYRNPKLLDSRFETKQFFICVLIDTAS